MITAAASWMKYHSLVNRPVTAHEWRMHAELGDRRWREWDAYRRYRAAVHLDIIEPDAAPGAVFVAGVPLVPLSTGALVAGQPLTSAELFDLADKLADLAETGVTA